MPHLMLRSLVSRDDHELFVFQITYSLDGPWYPASVKSSFKGVTGRLTCRTQE